MQVKESKPMKKLVKTAAVLGMLGTIATGVYAFDFGGLFKNNTKFSTPSFEYAGLDQMDSLSGWVKVPLTQDEKVYFSAEADATFQYSNSNLSLGGQAGTASFYLNLPLCKLTLYSNLWNGIFQLNAGRFTAADSTGMILSQTTDGIQGTFSSNYVKAILYAGYTGLTNSRTDYIIDGDSSTFSYDASAVYQFNSPYALTSLSVALPFLFSNQTLAFEGLAAFGLPGITGDNSGDNRYYLTALMNGPIVKNLYYSVSTTFGLGDGVTNLSRAAFTFYPTVLDSSVALEILYASGNNGFLSPFRGFTSQSAYLASGSTEYSGIIKAGLSGSIRPVSKLFISLGTDVVMSVADSFGYSGFQWFTQLQYQPFTDLKVGLAANQFIGQDSSLNNMGISLNLTFAF